MQQLNRSFDSSAPAARLPASADTGHTVQFYENEHFLTAAVADFLGDGLTPGQPAIVIATEPHRDAFLLRLRAKGIDVDRAQRSGRFVVLDASDTLATFMNGATPDGDRFFATIGGVIERALRGSDFTTVRAYGEMVDVLWKDGNTDGAIRLEELWNELAGTYSFSLLCAYSMGNFYRASDLTRLAEVCRQHTHVVPTERYTLADEDTRLVEIALLQQRAQALEAELAHRKELERRLRETLATQRRNEESLRRSEAELSRSVAERDEALHRERAARCDAESANRAKSDFLAIMSHELRTPLNAISGHAQLLQMELHGPLTDQQRTAIDRIERSQRHLLSLINDVLNLARIETGRAHYDLEDIAVNSLLSETRAMIEPRIIAGQLICDIPWLDEEIHIHADREKTHQILLNLLTNAAKFTPAGGRIAMEVEERDLPSAVVLIHVRDTGIGIAAEKLTAIWEPFVQLETRLSSRQDGVGLGLTISRDLARGMGGDIAVTSVVGEGTTFTVTLPKAV